MEKINLRYSIKNISIPSEKEYKLKLIEKTESFLKKMRWKAFFFINSKLPFKDDHNYINYGINSIKYSPQIKEMSSFEKDVIDLIKTIKFRKIKNTFQDKMKKDIKTIQMTNKTLIKGVKTSNMYKLSKEDYNHLLTNAITTTYKKADTKLKDKIYKEGKDVLRNHDVYDKIKINGSSGCFITLKDHKENFINNPTVRLLNPAKNEVGRISKIFLSQINNEVKNKLLVNQWQSTLNVTDW